MSSGGCRVKASTQMEELSIFVHGVLFSLHIIGVLYNLRRRNTFDVVAHTLAAAYDLDAALHHVHSLKELE